MYAYLACCHGMTKPGVSRSFCVSASFCSAIIRVFFFLLSSLSAVCHLPRNVEFAPRYFASGNGNFSSWRCRCLQYRNFPGKYRGYPCPLGLPGCSPLAPGCPQAGSGLRAVRPGAWCQGATLRRGGKGHRLPRCPENIFGALLSQGGCMQSCASVCKTSGVNSRGGAMHGSAAACRGAGATLRRLESRPWSLPLN